MKHSSSKPAPVTFKGFGLLIAVILAGYLGFLGSLGWGIHSTLGNGASIISEASASAPQETKATTAQ